MRHTLRARKRARAALAALGDIGGAVRGLRKSLFCIFTSNGAFRDLQKVWSHLLASDNANVTLHVEIAETVEDIIAGAAAEEVPAGHAVHWSGAVRDGESP